MADADAAVRLAGHDADRRGRRGGPAPGRFNAARIYAQAVEFAAAGVGRQGERAVSLYRAYRSRALDLLRQALEDVPAPERAQLLSDPALRPLRLGRGAGKKSRQGIIQSDRPDPIRRVGRLCRRLPIRPDPRQDGKP